MANSRNIWKNLRHLLEVGSQILDTHHVFVPALQCSFSRFISSFMPFASCCNSSHAKWFSETWAQQRKHSSRRKPFSTEPWICCRKRHENIVESSPSHKLCLSHMRWNRGDVGTNLPHLLGTVHLWVFFLWRMKWNCLPLQPKQIHFWGSRMPSQKSQKSLSGQNENPQNGTYIFGTTIGKVLNYMSKSGEYSAPGAVVLSPSAAVLPHPVPRL